MKPIISSLLDTDLYKLTMQQAVISKFPDVNVKYKFFDRNGNKYPPGFENKLHQEISMI